MEVCRLCLDLLQNHNDIVPLDAKCKDLIHYVMPELNLEVSDKPIICANCARSLDEVHDFKIKCYENERNTNIKEVFDISNGKKIKERSCRTCLTPIECDSFTSLNSSEPHSYVKVMQTSCLPELDLKLTSDPVMCSDCLNKLQKFHYFKSNCSNVENKLVGFCEIYGTDTSSQIVLSSVLEADLDDQLTVKLEDATLQPYKENDKNSLEVLANGTIKQEDYNMVINNKKEPPCEAGQNSNLKANIARTRAKTKKKQPSSAAKYNCKVCKKTFATNYNNRLHVECHVAVDSFACDNCGATFGHFSWLRVHRLSHTGKKPFVCAVCGMKFAHKSTYGVHKLTHVKPEDKPYECDVCGGRFTMRAVMLRHRIVHTGEKPYGCALCATRFTQKSNLKKHLRKHKYGPPPKQFSCAHCAKMFVTKYSLGFHIDTCHNSVKPHACDECGDTFRHKANLLVHVKMVHRGVEPPKCDVCGMLFANKSSMRYHRQTHDGARPYQCDVCQKRFVKETVLRSHVRTHTGEKPFECHVCGRRYTDKSKLNYHMKKRCLNPAVSHKLRAKMPFVKVEPP